jgi:glycosyltransferase involved in cell wall biosynthesis
MILLDSLYINNSGGKVLLNILIQELNQSKLDVYYLLDKRCEGSYPFLPKEKVTYLEAGLIRRHQFYKVHGHQFTKVFCFGNIPPTIKLKVPVYTYFHNLLLIEQPQQYPFKSKLSKKLKGFLIRFLKKNTNKFIVQSMNVKQSLIHYLNFKEEDCLIIPFYRELSLDSLPSTKKKEFVYVSNGNVHKNHTTLLQAWELLKKEGIILPLHLTITQEYSELLLSIEAYKKNGVHIVNHSFVDVKTLYSSCKYLIYPSLIESFGLGLIEAIDCNTEVIAADLPYVDAVVSPLRKFNPLSPASIASAVKESLMVESDHLISKKKVENQLNQIVELLEA